MARVPNRGARQVSDLPHAFPRLSGLRPDFIGRRPKLGTRLSASQILAAHLNGKVPGSEWAVSVVSQNLIRLKSHLAKPITRLLHHLERAADKCNGRLQIG